MKTIGLIGGMSWQSSIEYYRIINELVAQKLGGQHSVECVMVSLNLDPILVLRDADDWTSLASMMVAAIRRVEAAGADFTLICSNTMHNRIEDIEMQVTKPILHIGDVTAEAALKCGFKRLGLLGTRFTIEQDFYRGRLEKKYGLQVLVPDEDDIAFVHYVIYEELDFAILRPESKRRFVQIIERLAAQGAEAVILGCTEIPLLVNQEDTAVPLLDTTMLHATAAVDLALA
jgi:aspartate racemase